MYLHVHQKEVFRKIAKLKKFIARKIRRVVAKGGGVLFFHDTENTRSPCNLIGVIRVGNVLWLDR